MCNDSRALSKKLIYRPLLALGVLLALVLACSQGWSQATQGSVAGNVKDPKGAVVPGANVTLTNTAEGTTRTTTTNSAGDYRFVDVKAGTYTVAIEVQGFERFVVENAALEVRQELRVDAKLTVGAVQQEVTVNGDAISAIQTESPTISATFTTDDADNLPVNTRASFSGTSAAAIFGALPGVQSDASGISLKAHCRSRWKWQWTV